jgi:phage/plasmid-like protein (TIGR03299 family)
MAHGLFQNTMAYVGEQPWHRLGRRVPAHVTAAEMIKAANLDWQVRKKPAPGARKIKDEPVTYDRYLIVRDAVDPGTEGVALAFVSSRYEPLQNEEAFSFFAPFIENKWAQFHTAGALNQGQRIWVLARITGDILIGKTDVIERFLLLSNSHNGSGAVTIRFTPIRVVCQNTLNLAAKGGSGVISVPHTKNIAKHLAKAQAQEMKHIIDHVFDDAQQLFGQMALHRMQAKDTDYFLELLFPRTEGQRKNGKVPARWKRVKAILGDEKVTPPETKETLWAIYNAIVRDEDYRQAKSEAPDSRLDRVWFGRGNELKLRALEAARQQVRLAA